MELADSTLINSRLKELEGWEYSNESISKVFKFADFSGAVAFIVKIAAEAEKMDHHPDILLFNYNNLKITLSTHSKGGVTENDFELAGKINNLGKSV